MDESLQQALLGAQLPTLPAVAVQLIGLGQSEHADVTQLVDIVIRDPALSSTLLRLANSAAYRRVTPADTLTLATSYLGFEPSRMIALSATLVPALAGDREQPFCYTPYWRRALLAASCSRAIARRLFPRDVESVSLAALLQDVGMLAIAQLPNAVYQGQACETFDHKGAVAREREVLGEDHATIGAWLLKRWEFPENLVDAVAVSNDYSRWQAEGKAGDFDGAVMASGLMADAWMSADQPEAVPTLHDRICALLGAGWDDVIEIMTEASAEVPIVEALCSTKVMDEASLQAALDVLAVAKVDAAGQAE
ncbi:HDOD domain-containing protein [Thiosocius teredinicola]|uniref:HDOD domain-containing protein n=1 Tax=Thiosocius teredinicola TaxID=1973002 RepID=UPI000990C4A9